jgi:hypothetical protein
MHTCTHAHMHNMHTCTHAHMHTCTHAHMHTCTTCTACTHAHTRTHIKQHATVEHAHGGGDGNGALVGAQRVPCASPCVHPDVLQGGVQGAGGQVLQPAAAKAHKSGAQPARRCTRIRCKEAVCACARIRARRARRERCNNEESDGGTTVEGGCGNQTSPPATYRGPELNTDGGHVGRKVGTSDKAVQIHPDPVVPAGGRERGGMKGRHKANPASDSTTTQGTRLHGGGGGTRGARGHCRPAAPTSDPE